MVLSLLQLSRPKPAISPRYPHRAKTDHLNPIRYWADLKLGFSLSQGKSMSSLLCSCFNIFFKSCYFKKYYLLIFGCIKSWLQHVGSPRQHSGFSLVEVHGFSSCPVGLVAPQHILSSRPGIEPASFALEGGWTTREVPAFVFNTETSTEGEFCSLTVPWNTKPVVFLVDIFHQEHHFVVCQVLKEVRAQKPFPG